MDVQELKDRLAAMGTSKEKQSELMKNAKIAEKLRTIFGNSESNSKLLLVQSQYTADKSITMAIENGLIVSEKALKSVVELGLAYEELEKLVMSETRTEEEIRQAAHAEKGPFKDVMKAMSERFKFNDPRKVAEIVQVALKERPQSDALPSAKANDDHAERDWLESGELTKLHRPGENAQASEEIRAAHLKRTGGVVVTRFPPEPNGFLHIGHAKALNLNFQYAKKHGGYTFLRFDDTNPKNEHIKYYKEIADDLSWLGFEPKYVTASSDYFERMIEIARTLIRKDKAYVCHLPFDDIRKYRRVDGAVERGKHTMPAAELLKKYIVHGKLHPQCSCPSSCDIHAHSGCCEEALESTFKLSPFRNRSPELNLKLFEEMVEGKWKEGTAVLRLKMEESSKNPFMLDLVAFRVIDVPHPLTGTHYKVYPSYDFALCVCDSLEDVTHSFCSKEFFTRQESYRWLIDAAGLYRPVQWEFSRLNISGAMISKRKIKKLLKDKAIKSLDDPRLFTLKGLKRRGFTPSAINKFCEKVGITFSESSIDVKMLESFVRDDLNTVAARVMCVADPILCVFVCDTCLEDACEIISQGDVMVEVVEGALAYAEKAYALMEKRVDEAGSNEKAEIKKAHRKITRLCKKALRCLVKMKDAGDDTQKKISRFVRARSVISSIKSCAERAGVSLPEDVDGLWKERLFGQCACNNVVRLVLDVAKQPCVECDRIFYIDRSDFSQTPDSQFLRLAPAQPVGLLGLFAVELVEEIGNVLIVKRTDEKPQKFIQWVSRPVAVRLNMYSELLSPNGTINMDSLRVAKGYCDERVKNAQPYDKFQFVRMGYFCVDKRSTRKRLAFNLTVALKSSFS